MGKFSEIIERLRFDASNMLSDAEDLESGRRRQGNLGGEDESESLAAMFRDKAASLLRISDAYKRRDG